MRQGSVENPTIRPSDFWPKCSSELKQCKVEKDDDQFILAILSKHGLDYPVFVSTFHTGKLITLNWKTLSLDAFIKTLTNEHDKLIHMRILGSSKY